MASSLLTSSYVQEFNMHFGGDKQSSNHSRSKALSPSVHGIFNGFHPQNSQGVQLLGQVSLLTVVYAYGVGMENDSLSCITSSPL